MSGFCKLLIFTIIFSVGSSKKIELPSELQEYVDDLHKMCLDKSSIQESDHEAYDIRSNKDEKMMCYMKCLMLESKWMKPNGVINYEFIEAQAYPEIKDILMDALSKCQVIEDGKNLCEKAYNFNKCLHTVDPENWFFV